MELLSNKIWIKKCSVIDGLDRRFWKNIHFSVISIEHSIEKFIEYGNNEPQLKIIFAKSIVMELWNIRSFLKEGLKTNISAFDGNFPNIKNLRDSYAHIDERLVNMKHDQPLFVTPKTMCGGKVHRGHGNGTWNANADLLFNLEITGNEFSSIFGLVDDYLICNDSKKIIEFRINRKITKKLEKIMIS